MAENYLNSVENADKGLEAVMKSSIPFKHNLGVQNAHFLKLYDEEIQGKSIEGLDKILKKIPENLRNLLEVINLCDKLKHNLERLVITRDNKGRHNGTDRDSGINSIVSQDLEDHRTSVGPHVQDSSAHTHPESITIHEDSREAVEDTEC